MRKINGILYRVRTPYAGYLVEVSEENSFQELAEYCASLSLKGAAITSVVRVFADSRDTPRMSVLSSPEYKEAMKKLEAKQSDKEQEPDAPATHQLWARMGVTMDITAEEEQRIFADYSGDAAMLRKMLSEGRIRVDGNTYVPGPCVEEFNKKYGTKYEEDDIDITD